jgi:hypothetical protein
LKEVPKAFGFGRMYILMVEFWKISVNHTCTGRVF